MSRKLFLLLMYVGVAVGKSFCHQESEPQTSKTFWSFIAGLSLFSMFIGPIQSCNIC